MDIDSIAPGSNFEERVSEALASCSTAVILIGSEWVSARGADGRRRLDEEADYVRLEVSTASLVRR